MMTTGTKTPSSPPKRRRLFSSIGSKVTLILLSLGATAAVVGVLVTLAFSHVSTDMTKLTQNLLPQLDASATLTQAVGQSRDSMTSILLAETSEELSQAQIQAETATTQLNQGVQRLTRSQQPAFVAAVDNTEHALGNLLQARQDMFASEARIQALITELQSDSRTLQSQLLEEANHAYMDLEFGGEETITAIENTLSSLVDDHFGTLQNLLEVQAEINLLAGMSLGIGQIREVSMKKQMTQIAKTSLARLKLFLENPEQNGISAEGAEVLNQSAQTLEAMLNARRSEQKALRSMVLDTRIDSANVLIEAIDDTVFELTMAAERSSASNRAVVQHLLDNEVDILNQLLQMSKLINTLQMAALAVVTADDVARAETAAEALTRAATALSGFADFKDGQLADSILAVAAKADAENGLAALRIATINSRANSVELSQTAAEAVTTIAQQANALSSQSQTAIADMAHLLTEDVNTTKQRMDILLGVSAAVLLLALFLTRQLITRPLKRISETTEHLAAGNMDPVVGFEKSSEEIWRIARALAVFRDGLVEKEEMSKATELERQQRQEEQTTAIAAIGNGLERLSQGDLTVRMEDEISEGYEKLRDDFNATLETLQATVVDVINAADSIRRGAAEITQASDDLSHRTESQASTLEQTAAALAQMTASVKSSADGAQSVEAIVHEAKNEAEESGYVVQNAVSAMTEIQNSANHISQIIAVIDDIAFQTNLLALNAGVEAARAGDAGKGFAVVASEVRALAQRSSDAAMEIKSLIGNSTDQVAHGVDLVGKAGDALTSIVSRVGHISDLVSEIAAGASEQSTGLGEINIGVSQLDQVTQQNAAMVEEATAASHMLNSDASNLANLVKRFNTETAFVPQATVPRNIERPEPPVQALAS